MRGKNGVFNNSSHNFDFNSQNSWSQFKRLKENTYSTRVGVFKERDTD